jgi:hypothetical protein
LTTDLIEVLDAGLSINGLRKILTCPAKKMLLLEIERKRPDIIMMALDLYGRIDGIETS